MSVKCVDYVIENSFLRKPLFFFFFAIHLCPHDPHSKRSTYKRPTVPCRQDMSVARRRACASRRGATRLDGAAVIKSATSWRQHGGVVVVADRHGGTKRYFIVIVINYCLWAAKSTSGGDTYRNRRRGRHREKSSSRVGDGDGVHDDVHRRYVCRHPADHGCCKTHIGVPRLSARTQCVSCVQTPPPRPTRRVCFHASW